MAIRLIALDLDGTLLNSRSQIPPENARALGAAVERGVQIVLVTGRRFEFALAAVEDLALPLTFIVTNGALIKTRDGQTLYRRVLARDVAAEVLETTRHFRETAAVVFDRTAAPQVVYERIDWDDPLRRGYFHKQRPYLGEVLPLEACLTEDPVQVMFTGTFTEMRTVLGLLGPGADARRFSMTATEYQAKDFSLVDVVGPGCSKGTALAEWAGRLGVRRDEVLAAGDNLNDVEMLAYAGVGVVMGNAVPELKRGGWHVTTTNDEGGVAAAVDAFVLRPEGRPAAGAGEARRRPAPDSGALSGRERGCAAVEPG